MTKIIVYTDEVVEETPLIKTKMLDILQKPKSQYINPIKFYAKLLKVTLRCNFYEIIFNRITDNEWKSNCEMDQFPKFSQNLKDFKDNFIIVENFNELVVIDEKLERIYWFRNINGRPAVCVGIFGLHEIEKLKDFDYVVVNYDNIYFINESKNSSIYTSLPHSKEIVDDNFIQFYNFKNCNIKKDEINQIKYCSFSKENKFSDLTFVNNMITIKENYDELIDFKKEYTDKVYLEIVHDKKC